MGGKRKKSGSEAAAEFETDYENEKYINKENKKQKKLVEEKKGETLPSMIKNKEKRSAVHAKLKQEKKLEKRKKIKARDAAEKRALELGEEVWWPFLFFFLNIWGVIALSEANCLTLFC